MTNWKLFVGIAAICAVTAMARPKWGPPPPDAFKWLPTEAKDKLKSIHEDHSLKWEERKKMIDEVFDSLPQEIMDKMPLPPGFDKLPSDIQEQAKAINSDRTIKWGEKREKIRALINSLPEEQRRLVPFPRFGGLVPPFGPRGLPPLVEELRKLIPHPPKFGGFGPFGPRHHRGFPPHPPPEFKEILGEELYNKLDAIHQDKNLTHKKDKIDEVMKGVSKETLKNIPLPPFLENLPADVQTKAQELRKLIPHPPKFGEFGPFGPRHHRGFPPHPPPEFKEILGEELYNKLDVIHQDKNLTREERFKKMDEFMSSLPSETLAKLPLPPPFRQLPEDVQNKIREIMHNFSIDFKQRMQKVREFIRTLPEEQQKLVPPPPPFFGGQGHGHRHGFLPRGPPADFKDILPTDKWEQLVELHKNDKLSWKEKKKQINEIMNSIPSETLMKLPLPPHLRKLSAENQQKIREFFADKSLSFDEKFQKTKEFIKSLPEAERKLARPPPPPGFENLPSDVKAKIDAIFENETLGHHERFEKVREIIDALPAEIRAKLPPPPAPFN
uniref:Uncharacterized protein n=1 Tax=Panagrolaimus sp. ES5 TaxID=591445 RepID=A0AC34FZL2_9BILA